MSEISLVEVGRLGKSYGFQGDIHFYLDEHIVLEQEPQFLFVHINGLPVPFKISRVGEHNGSMVVAFDKVESKEEIEAYKNGRVSIENEYVSIVENASSQYIGYMVYDQSSSLIGKIVDIVDQEPLLLLYVAAHDSDKEYILPYHEDLLVELSDEKQSLKIEIVDGLLDI